MKTPFYRIQHEFASRGYDGKTCWVHPRAAAIPSTAQAGNPTIVMTMSPLDLTGSDTFHAIASTRSDDLGKTWTPPRAQEHFHRLRVTDVEEVPQSSEAFIEKVVCDFSPQWHAASGNVLGIGHTAYYENDEVMHDRPRQTAYSTYDAARDDWQPWRTLELPDGDKFHNAGAGSVQRVDLANGEILLPIYFRLASGRYASTVLRCSFDGEEMKYLEHGTEVHHPSGRGLYEPSLTRFGDRFYLTLRNDLCGYVTSSADGLHFDEPQIWRFDDGQELGNYNTQQHWVAHSDGLFLVYTRRGLNNDHIFRHRAPMVIAQVDPQRLCIMRDTERVLIPERGARMGNFGVTQVSEHETWVTESEWMQNSGIYARTMLKKIGLGDPEGDRVPPKKYYFSRECEAFGSDNSVWIARILWDKPNSLAT